MPPARSRRHWPTYWICRIIGGFHERVEVVYECTFGRRLFVHRDACLGCQKDGDIYRLQKEEVEPKALQPSFVLRDAQKVREKRSGQLQRVSQKASASIMSFLVQPDAIMFC